MKSKKIKHKFKEYAFSRKTGGSEQTPTTEVNVVLSPQMNNLKNQLAQAFNEASPEILKSKLLRQMEILSGKPLTMKKETSTQNKTRKMIPIGKEETIFVNKLKPDIIPAGQINYIDAYLKKLISGKMKGFLYDPSETYKGGPFTDNQMRHIRDTITETQKGESSVLFNGYLRRMAANLEIGTDKFFQSDSKENKLKEIVEKLEIKKNSADSAIRTANSLRTPAAYKNASKAIAETAQAMKEAVELMNTTRGGAEMKEQPPTSNSSEINKLKYEIKEQIQICEEKIKEMNKSLNGVNTIEDGSPANKALKEIIRALDTSKELFEKLKKLLAQAKSKPGVDAKPKVTSAPLE